METGNWSAVPKTTDQVVTLGAGLGVGSTTGLRSVVTNMNGSTDYAMKSNELFHMDHNEEITISFWAKQPQQERDWYHGFRKQMQVDG